MSLSTLELQLRNITEPLTDTQIELLEEYNQLVKKIDEAEAYLASTDYKVLPDYDKPDAEIVTKRQEARELIRANEQE